MPSTDEDQQSLSACSNEHEYDCISLPLQTYTTIFSEDFCKGVLQIYFNSWNVTKAVYVYRQITTNFLEN